MSTEAPSNGELVRRFEDATTRLTKQLEALTTEIREDRAEASRTYVRRDVYDAERRADEAARNDVAKDVKKLEDKDAAATGFRRQMLVSGAVMVISVLVSIVLNVVNLLAR
ncbi:hypothetical protein INN71_02790 [Nocardioides sp. ChNu-153]|uniref:hypothetical protein n=1 Tax=Nocardioides sp. ChNu-153 TaxID=2779364 RepID=UPI00264AC0CC|nr:hypothetical protein [Nocardioides sp. ChNu-153]MDN7120313.1 hypothetical protein [Nocardioides sp. ChNu-153]